MGQTLCDPDLALRLSVFTSQNGMSILTCKLILRIGKDPCKVPSAVPGDSSCSINIRCN